MATLAEITTLFEGGVDAELLEAKISAQCLKTAEAIRVELDTTPNHANRLIWAKQCFQNHKVKGEEMFPALIAANASAALSAILGASDGTIATNVDAAVDIFADGS